jgi:hypothetical protein
MSTLPDEKRGAALEPAVSRAVERVQAFAARRLSATEMDAWINAPWADEDLEEARSLIAWHMRRYPTPAARLKHAREAYARWARSIPTASIVSEVPEDDLIIEVE